jgi:sugar phosphate isomerase/epimerase
MFMTFSVDNVQVNIPFTMLYESYLDRFIEYKLNPEISFDAEALDRYSVSDAVRIANELFACGLVITLHAPFMDLSPGSPDPQVRAITRKRFEQTLRFIPVLKPKTFVCHIGYDEQRYGYMRDLWIENSIKMWSWLGRCVRDEGSLLMLENVFERGPEDIEVLLDRLEKEEVGFCLDTGHQAAFGRVPLETWVTSLESHIGQLHINDNKGKRDEHLAIGKGTIDFREFFEQIKAIRREPPIITLEPHGEEDLWPSFEYLEKVWPW